jgi:hypothetical protein
MTWRRIAEKRQLAKSWRMSAEKRLKYFIENTGGGGVFSSEA